LTFFKCKTKLEHAHVVTLRFLR